MNLKPLLKTLSGTAGYVTPLLHVVDLRGQNSTVTALSSASGTPAILFYVMQIALNVFIYNLLHKYKVLIIRFIFLHSLHPGFESLYG